MSSDPRPDDEVLPVPEEVLLVPAEVLLPLDDEPLLLDLPPEDEPLLLEPELLERLLPDELPDELLEPLEPPPFLATSTTGVSVCWRSVLAWKDSAASGIGLNGIGMAMAGAALVRTAARNRAERVEEVCIVGSICEWDFFP
ncbi:MAG: hypothetical protein RLY71_3405 [Pseudomonadota bacterium]